MSSPDDEANAVETVRNVPDESGRFPVVGIGASAGGLGPLEGLVRRLSHCRTAFVVLQHVAPSRSRTLCDLLTTRTTLKVATIENGMSLAPDAVYVAPPNARVTVGGGTFRVESRAQAVHLPIDALFRSLGETFGARAIGVILSGAGSDGTAGLRAIKDAGGITFVQRPDTADQPGMPDSALQAAVADYCMSPTEIGDELMRLSSHPYVAAARPRNVLDGDARSRIFEQLRRAYGVDFASYTPKTIARRIERRMALQRIDRVLDYVKLVETSSQELGILYSDLLIGVTSNEELQSTNEELEDSKAELQSMNAELTRLNEELQKLISTLPHVMMLLDDQLRLVWANKSFFAAFEVGDEILGHPFEEVWNVREEHAQLWALLENTATGGKPFKGVVVEHPFGRTHETPMTFSAQCIPAEGSRAAQTLVVMEEAGGCSAP